MNEFNGVKSQLGLRLSGIMIQSGIQSGSVPK